MHMISRYGVLALPLLLVACSIQPATQAMLDAYHLSSKERSESRLNPALSYLRVMVGGSEALLVLGYVDPSAHGPVQVWYSGDSNVLRLSAGRLVGASIKGVVDWSGVAFEHLPDWQVVGARADFVRRRDVSPGYRHGLRDEMRIERVAPPDDSNLVGISPASLSWYEERVVGGPDDGLMARYAVAQTGQLGAKVVYGEQCLTREYCLSWQHWPVDAGGAP